MTRKVIIDGDPGIGEAVALCMALFDPRLEVVAVTAVAGCVSAKQATLNTQTLIDHLDPPRMPRAGAAMDLEQAPPVTHVPSQGTDGLGNSNLKSVRHQHTHLSEKLIIDEVRANPDEISILCLGPLTNVARAFQRDPMLPTMIDRLVIAGGSWGGVGNVTPAAEFNMHYDPVGAREVFQSPTTKTLVSLDVTRRVPFHLDLIDQLPADTTRAGMLLRQIVPFYFRSYRQGLGTESIQLPEAVALIALLHPELFETEEMLGDVETRGELTMGATVFDRRPNVGLRSNMEVAISAHAAAITDSLVRGLRRANDYT
ncbi:MAG: nucleoside hydrolase [Planctomycetales bacterium]|nr:nucleoside hydrolase [Planctomycetales bacterium]